MLIAEGHDLVRVHIGLSRLIGQCKAMLDRGIILATCHASPGPHSIPFIPLRLVNDLPQVCQVSPQVKRTQPAVLVATTQGTTMDGYYRLQYLYAPPGGRIVLLISLPRIIVAWRKKQYSRLHGPLMALWELLRYTRIVGIWRDSSVLRAWNRVMSVETDRSIPQIIYGVPFSCSHVPQGS